MTPLALFLTCAPLISPVTMAAIAQHESAMNPLAVHDNTTGASYHPRNEVEAIALANSLIASGHSVDLGMGQINSKNLSWLGQTAQTIFKPCFNLNAAQTVLLGAWKQSGGNLSGTLSAYNTGKVDSSIGANYAAKVYAQALHPHPVVPAIPGGKLPAWMSQEMAGTQTIKPKELTSLTLTRLTPQNIQTLQATAQPTAAVWPPPVRAIRQSPRKLEDTPEGSPLQPQGMDLRPR
jgi:type IV secretion system protein VirB1